jgi:hypothetical protein
MADWKCISKLVHQNKRMVFMPHDIPVQHSHNNEWIWQLTVSSTQNFQQNKNKQWESQKHPQLDDGGD